MLDYRLFCSFCEQEQKHSERQTISRPMQGDVPLADMLKCNHCGEYNPRNGDAETAARYRKLVDQPGARKIENVVVAQIDYWQKRATAQGRKSAQNAKERSEKRIQGEHRN